MFHEIIGALAGADLALGHHYGRHTGASLAIGADGGGSMEQLAAVLSQNPSLAAALAAPNAQDNLLRAIAGRNARAVIERQPQDSRTLTLPFPETLVPAPAGTVREIQVLPQCLFRCERLLIPSDIAGLIVIDDIRVGTVSQFSAIGPVPARAFSEVAVGVGTLFDTAQPGLTITLRVRNISGNDVTFRAVMFGSSVR